MGIPETTPQEEDQAPALLGDQQEGEHNNKVKQLAAEMCSLEAKALEVSPEVIGSLLEGFGVSNVQAHDVLGTDDEAAKQLPGKLLGLLLTLPKQAANPTSGQSDDSKFLIKQAGKNMCATIATIHVIANQMASSVPSTTPLGAFLASAKGVKPEARGNILLHDTDLLLAHNKAAEKGVSKQVDGEADHHTIAIIQEGDSVFALDGLLGSVAKVEAASMPSAAKMLIGGIREGHASLLALVNV